MIAAKALADLFDPVKMNYEIHGNTLPHLHLHLYPRYKDDPYDTGVLRPEAPTTRTADDLRRIARFHVGLLQLIEHPSRGIELRIFGYELLHERKLLGRIRLLHDLLQQATRRTCQRLDRHWGHHKAGQVGVDCQLLIKGAQRRGLET